MANALDRVLGTSYERCCITVRNLPHVPLFTESVCLLIFIGSKEDKLDSDDLSDDDDEEDDEGEEREEKEEGSSGHAEMNGTETLDGLRAYMDQMDQELMSTNIGQSFNLTVNYACDYTLYKSPYTSLCLNLIYIIYRYCSFSN